MGATLEETVRALEETVRALEQRLDRQAKAIRALRAQAAGGGAGQGGAGQGGAVSQGGATGSTKTPGADGQVDGAVWSIPEVCLMCRGEKGQGRERLLTCAPCGAKYQAQRRKDHEGPKVVYASCLSCGAGKSLGGALQCARCSKAYAEWKRGDVVVAG